MQAAIYLPRDEMLAIKRIDLEKVGASIDEMQVFSEIQFILAVASACMSKVFYVVLGSLLLNSFLLIIKNIDE